MRIQAPFPAEPGSLGLFHPGKHDHTLRSIQACADAALQAIGPKLDELYGKTGRPSIAPERLLKGQLLIALGELEEPEEGWPAAQRRLATAPGWWTSRASGARTRRTSQRADAGGSVTAKLQSFVVGAVMNLPRLIPRMLACVGLALACGGQAFGETIRIAGSTCTAPPRLNCPNGDCPKDLLTEPGEAVEPQSGRKFFLDFPCDLKPGEKVNFILSMHGATSNGAWMRHYFPAVDYKEKYRLVIATPTSATATRIWNGETDDATLQRIVDLVFEKFGKANIRTFWLAGHSQGGITENRLVCTPYFSNKVDGWLSLSGGRIGKVDLVPDFFGAPQQGVAAGPPGARGGNGGAGAGVASIPPCDFSFIFATGEKEITALPETSPWAEKYACGARVRKADIVDRHPGHVTAANQPQRASMGGFAMPGTADVFVYPKCGGGRLVADVLRLDKGHSQGLEPKVTEALIRMMLSAPRGKAQAR